MKQRRLMICREGFYYLFVLAFIVGGAILRDVNLLLALAGMMIAALVLNGRLAWAMLARLTVRREAPPRVVAGQPFEVSLVVFNPRRRLAAWSIRLEDEITPISPPAPDRAGRERPWLAAALVQRVGAGQESMAGYRCLLPRRGRYRLGPVRLSTRFPLGLMRATGWVETTQEIVVTPKPGRLSRDWRRLVAQTREGGQVAAGRSARADGDFFALREWRPGDSRRWIHWRATARTQELTVRQFEQRRTSQAAIVLDLGLATADPQLVEAAVSFAAAATTDLCRSGGGYVGLFAGGAKPCGLGGSGSAQLLQRMLTCLADVEPAGRAATGGESLADVLMRAARDAPAGAPLVIVSVASRPPAEFWQALPEAARLAPRLIWLDAQGGRTTRPQPREAAT